jgi:hypothetical protein
MSKFIQGFFLIIRARGLGGIYKQGCRCVGERLSAKAGGYKLEASDTLGVCIPKKLTRLFQRNKNRRRPVTVDM